MKRDPIEDLTLELANVLKARRISLGLSKNKLSQLAGVAYQTVAFIEDAERHPTVATVARLATAMNTTASKLINEAEKKTTKG